jgi:RNA polymerase sigma-54 factor
MNPRQQRKVAKSLGCTREELSAALEEIHQLDPFPGCNFTDATPSYILPDLLLVDEEGKFRLELNVSHTPRLRISPSYQRLLADPQASTFLKKKLTAAKWVLRSLEKREDTLARVGSHLVEKQEEFLRKGGYYLKPLSLREVAQALEVHESTISRAVKGKYIDTPRGVFPLRVLLPAGLPQQGGPTSESRLKEEIRRILAQEDKSQPLSDEEIARSLEKAGIHLARRTVTKYRKSLGIPIRGKRKVRTDRY